MELPGWWAVRRWVPPQGQRPPGYVPEEGDIHEVVEVDRKYVGAIIGKNGTGISRIKAHCNASVQVKRMFFQFCFLKARQRFLGRMFSRPKNCWRALWR